MPVCGSGVLVCSWSLLIRGPIVPAVRQKLHLACCADFRNRLFVLSAPAFATPLITVLRQDSRLIAPGADPAGANIQSYGADSGNHQVGSTGANGVFNG